MQIRHYETIEEKLKKIGIQEMKDLLSEKCSQSLKNCSLKNISDAEVKCICGNEYREADIVLIIAENSCTNGLALTYESFCIYSSEQDPCRYIIPYENIQGVDIASKFQKYREITIRYDNSELLLNNACFMKGLLSNEIMKSLAEYLIYASQIK